LSLSTIIISQEPITDINPDIFELLLNYNADHTIIDNYGHIPSYYYNYNNGNIKLHLPLVENIMETRGI
jgi:hypothetical protein